MLCPEISNFPLPKVYIREDKDVDIKAVTQFIHMNDFYKNVIVTIPDEYSITFFQDVLSLDTEYYRLSNCSVAEFVNRNFIEYYIKFGKVTCLSIDRNCIVQNCAAITPDGKLTIHVLEFIYQTLGLEGIKRPHGYYEIAIDLKTLKHFEKMKMALAKLEAFDFYLTWEPNDLKVCPSSIAKYFWDKKIEVSSHNITFETLSPHVKQIPTLADVDVDEIVEWMGMLVHKGDLSPTEEYISTYSEPECTVPIQSTRISILIAKGFIIPSTLTTLCDNLIQYMSSRAIDNYWVAISIQGMEESLWQFSSSSPAMFQSHNSSSSIFFTEKGCTIYSAAQLKYS